MENPPPRFQKTIWLFTGLGTLGGIGVLTADYYAAMPLMWASFALVMVGSIGITLSTIWHTRRQLNRLSRRDQPAITAKRRG